jgi:hypothetical protein
MKNLNKYVETNNIFKFSGIASLSMDHLLIPVVFNFRRAYFFLF